MAILEMKWPNTHVRVALSPHFVAPGSGPGSTRPLRQIHSAFAANSFPGHVGLYLYIDGNQLICDSRLQWLKDGEARGWLHPNLVQCASGVIWVNVTLPAPPPGTPKIVMSTHCCWKRVTLKTGDFVWHGTRTKGKINCGPKPSDL